MLKHILFLIVAGQALLAGIEAEEPREQNPAQESQMLSIRLRGSRSQVTAGSGFQMTADLKNISNTNIFLRAKDFVLVVPAEFTGTRVNDDSRCTWMAYFPTEGGRAVAQGSILIRAGDPYHVYWVPSPESFSTTNTEPVEQKRFGLFGQLASELRFLLFTPGDYKVTVVAKCWTNAPSAGTKREDRGNPTPSEEEADGTDTDTDFRLVTQSATLKFIAPQSVLLVGAMLGGALGFLVLPRKAPPEGTASARFKTANWAERMAITGSAISRFLGAVLFSALATILISRVSETQFLIHVSVNDFWGAIAIGFVANYLGIQALDKLKGSANSARAQTPALGTQPASDTKTPDTVS